MPATQINPSTRIRVEITSRARCHDAAGPSFSHVLVKVAVNAVESAPSAKRSRSRFGIRNAAIKTSERLAAPNMKAKTTSRSKPIRREPRTEMRTTTVERLEPRFLGPGGAWLIGWGSLMSGLLGSELLRRG